MRKGFTFALITLALLIAGCQGQSQNSTEDKTQPKEGDWTAFQQKFKEAGFPFKCSHPSDNAEVISISLFKEFLTPILSPDFGPVTAEAPYSVYPLGKVPIGSEKWLLLLFISEEMDDYRVAATYTKDGNFIASKKVSNLRPCISSTLEIPSGTCIIESGEETHGCMEPSDEEKIVEFTNYFTITPDGKITPSTTPCDK